MGQTIWIVRHGLRVDYKNKEWWKTAEYPDDPGLSPNGIIQAEEIARRLKDEKIDHIFCSPFLRTIETACRIAGVLGLKIKLEAGLGEWHYEKYFKDPGPVIIPIEEKAKMFPEIDMSYSSGVIPVFPETAEEMSARVGRAVEHITRNFTGNMLFVGHGGSVDSSVWHLIGESVEVDSSLACICKVVRDNGRWILELNNDSSHLSNPVFDA